MNAQSMWAQTPAEERAAIMRRAAELFEQERGALLSMIVRETGGVHGKAETELAGTIGELVHSDALLIAPEGQMLPHPNPSKLSLA